jgi:hypothetical protein
MYVSQRVPLQPEKATLPRERNMGTATSGLTVSCSRGDAAETSGRTPTSTVKGALTYTSLEGNAWKVTFKTSGIASAANDKSLLGTSK